MHWSPNGALGSRLNTTGGPEFVVCGTTTLYRMPEGMQVRLGTDRSVCGDPLRLQNRLLLGLLICFPENEMHQDVYAEKKVHLHHRYSANALRD